MEPPFRQGTSYAANGELRYVTTPPTLILSTTTPPNESDYDASSSSTTDSPLTSSSELNAPYMDARAYNSSSDDLVAMNGYGEEKEKEVEELEDELDLIATPQLDDVRLRLHSSDSAAYARSISLPTGAQIDELIGDIDSPLPTCNSCPSISVSAPSSLAASPVTIPTLSVVDHTFNPKPSPRRITKPARARSMKDILPSVLKSHTQQGNDHLHMSENQDRHCFHYDDVRQLLWMGVFDGHSGSSAAEFLSANLLNNVSSLLAPEGPYSVETLTSAMREGIALTERQFSQCGDCTDGACILLVCLVGPIIVVANLGDSRAVIGAITESGSNNAITGHQLTNDHNASNPKEALLARYRFLRNQNRLSDTDRIENYTEQQLIEMVKDVMGGDDIIENGRLITVELTRSFGDFATKKFCFNVLSNEPEFSVAKLDSLSRVLILASDGIWATLDNREASQIAYDTIRNLSHFYHGESAPAKKLVEKAVELGSGDDQTCLILNVKNYLNTIRLNNARPLNSLQAQDQAVTEAFSPLARSILSGVFVCDKSRNLLASSANKSFPVKIAEMTKRGAFVGSSKPSLFDEDARQAQLSASAAHTYSKSTHGRSGPPIASPDLPLFETKAAELAKNRRLGDEKAKSLTHIASPAVSRFDEDAKRQQKSASEAHLHTKNKYGLAGPPLADSGLSIFEAAAVQVSRVRKQEQEQAKRASSAI